MTVFLLGQTRYLKPLFCIPTSCSPPSCSFSLPARLGHGFPSLLSFPASLCPPAHPHRLGSTQVKLGQLHPAPGPDLCWEEFVAVGGASARLSQPWSGNWQDRSLIRLALTPLILRPRAGTHSPFWAATLGGGTETCLAFHIFTNAVTPVIL